MKNKRVFILLSIIFIGSIVLFYYEQLKQAYYNINSTQKEFDITESNYEKMLENFEMEKYYEAKREEYLEELNQLNFNSELSQEMVITMLNNYTDKNHIQISVIKFSDANIVSIYDNSIEIVESNGAALDECQFMSVTVEFKTGFNVLLNFIDDIKNNENDISITNIRIITWEGVLVYAVVDMKFYAVPFEVKV